MLCKSVFAGLVLSPFLKTVVTLACCQSTRTWPVSYDCWHIRFNTGAISFDANFSILAGTRSGPDAFTGFRFEETGSPSMSGR